MTIKFARFP